MQQQLVVDVLDQLDGQTCINERLLIQLADMFHEMDTANAVEIARLSEENRVDRDNIARLVAQLESHEKEFALLHLGEHNNRTTASQCTSLILDPFQCYMVCE